MSQLKQLLGVKRFMSNEALKVKTAQTDLEKKLDIEEQVQAILEKLANKSSEARLSSLLKAGVKYIYGEEYRFSREGKELLIGDDVVESDLFEGRGGGLVDLVALLLRILALKRGKGGKMQTLILDEPLRCFSWETPLIEFKQKHSTCGRYKTMPIGRVVRDSVPFVMESVALPEGKVMRGRVTGRFENGKSTDWYRIGWDGGYAYATGDHEFYVCGVKVKVNELKGRTKLDGVVDVENEGLKQCLLGTFLGDSTPQRRIDCRHANATFEQSRKAMNYLNWKVSAFKDLMGEGGPEKGGTYRYTLIHKVFDWYADILQVKRGFKNITEQWLELMKPLAFAVWYMDDGYYSPDGNIQISCSNFGYSGAQKMCRVLNAKFGIDASIYSGPEQRTKNKQEWVKIFIGKKCGGAGRFLDLVHPFIHRDYFYKDPCYAGDKPNVVMRLEREYAQEIIETEIRFVGCKRNRFSIQVDPFHNYVLPGGLLSANCVDRETALRASAFLRSLCDKLGITVLMVTHRQELVEDADVVYVIDKPKGGVTRVKRREYDADYHNEGAKDALDDAG